MKPKILALQTQKSNQNWHCLLSHLGHFHPNSISSCRSFLHSKCPEYSKCCSVVQAYTGSSVTVTRRFQYSAFPVLGCYSPFPLLDISSYWLLLDVSFTRHIQRKTLLAFLLNDFITRHFNYSTFQRSRFFSPLWS